MQHIGMPHDRIFNLYAYLSQATITLSAPVARGDYVVNLEAGHGVTSGHSVMLRERDHQYQGRVVTVAVDAITMDTPFSYPYTVDAIACRGTTNMAVDGSGTSVEFCVPGPVEGGADIHRYIIYIEDQSVMDTAKFGGIPALSRGIVIAYRNAEGELLQAQQAIRSNGEFAERAYDVAYDDKAPSGWYGFRCRRSWGGLDKSGAAPHIPGGVTPAKIVVIIQDDLSDLDAFRIVFQGHYTEE
jgi:hypothetical protein